MVSTQSRIRVIPAGLRSELKEAAFNHGYRSENGEADGWLYFRSDINVPGEIGLAVGEGGNVWFLSVGHPGVAAELNAPATAPLPQGMRAAFAFSDQSSLRDALHRTYVLSSTLPTLPLHEFEAAVASLGDTEAERLKRVRIGQDLFRRALLGYWNARCPLTLVVEPQLLRASHIVPWAECESDAERLDVHNGLLLAAHWDAAFDAGLVSFSEYGDALFGASLSVEARAVLQHENLPNLSLRPEHQHYLARHRRRHSFG